MHRKATGRSPANTFQIKGKFSTLWPPNYEMPGRTFFPPIPDMTVKIWKWKKKRGKCASWFAQSGSM